MIIEYVYFVLILIYYQNNVKNVIKSKFLILKNCYNITIAFIFLKIMSLKKNSLIVFMIIYYLNILTL